MNSSWHKPLVLVAFTGLAAQIHAASGSGETVGLGQTQTPAEQAPQPDGTIKVSWKDGFRFEAADKSFKAKIGGRLFFDTGFISTDSDFEAAFGREEDGAKFRAARMYMEGEVNENIEYKWQYDFAGGTNNKLKDVYIGFKDTPAGGVRVGQFKEPFSLEELTSSNHITFMERGAPNKLTPSRNIGVALADHTQSKRVTWSAGVFRDDGSDTGQDNGDGEYSLTGRITGTPIMDDASHLVHVGAAVSLRHLRNQAYAVSTKGESGITLQDIGAISVAAETVELAGLEAAWVNGPLSLQGEYVMSSADPVSGSDLDSDGFYAFISYFLTGESRSYKDSSGAFQRIKVNNPYGKDGGKGALELALRYSNLDLSEGSGVLASDIDSYTFGANWYLNNYTRLMFNYVHEEVDPGVGSEGSADILQFRLAIEF